MPSTQIGYDQHQRSNYNITTQPHIQVSAPNNQNDVNRRIQKIGNVMKRLGVSLFILQFLFLLYILVFVKMLY